MLAGLLIEPALDKYPILAFGEYRSIIDIGYQSAQEALATWVAGRRAGADGGVPRAGQ